MKLKMKLIDKAIHQIENLASEVSLREGCLFYDMELRGSTLRVFIDKEKGQASLDDCANISRALSEVLDSKQSLEIKESYELEVSTPGVERLLRRQWHFEKAIGETLSLKMKKGSSSSPSFSQGRLINFQDEVLTMQTEKGELEKIPFQDIHKGQVVFFKKGKVK